MAKKLVSFRFEKDFLAHIKAKSEKQKSTLTDYIVDNIKVVSKFKETKLPK